MQKVRVAFFCLPRVLRCPMPRYEPRSENAPGALGRVGVRPMQKSTPIAAVAVTPMGRRGGGGASSGRLSERKADAAVV